MVAATSVCPPVGRKYASGYLIRCHSGQFDCLRSLEASSCLQAHHAANWYIAPSHTAIKVSVVRSNQTQLQHYSEKAYGCPLLWKVAGYAHYQGQTSQVSSYVTCAAKCYQDRALRSSWRIKPSTGFGAIWPRGFRCCFVKPVFYITSKLPSRPGSAMPCSCSTFSTLTVPPPVRRGSASRFSRQGCKSAAIYLIIPS